MTTSFAVAPTKARSARVADDAYFDVVVAALRARLHKTAAGTSEPLETVLGPASELAERVAAVVPTTSWLAASVGPVYRQAGLAKACGCTRQAVNEWVKNRRLLALTTSDDVVLIPAFQLDRNLRPLRGLDVVLRLLTPEVVDDWMLASWLVAPQPTLDGASVIDSLAAGRDASVVTGVAEAARRRWAH